MTPTTISGETESLRNVQPTSNGRPSLSAGADHGHAVSWAAIFAGAAAAASLSLILLVLGVGLGLSSVSPWSSQGASATTVGTGTVIWLLFVALAASGTGGYLAGRLRARWAKAHVDEIYFRDTAHGFLAWSIATLVTAGLLTSAVGSILNGGAQAGGAVVGAAGSTATTLAAGAGGATMKSADSSGVSYFTDSLFRPMAPSAGASAPASAAVTNDAGSVASSTAETSRILTRSLANGAMSADDVKYVGQVVAQRTGLSQSDAEKRVNDTYTKAQQSVQEIETKAMEAAEKARRAAAYTALWLFISLLFGAFVSSLMATFGGRQRDI